MLNIVYNHTNAIALYEGIAPIIVKRIETIINKKGIFKGRGENRHKILLSDKLKTFLNCIKNDLVLKEFIISTPNQMKYLVEECARENDNLINHNTDDYKIIYNIFVEHAYKKLDKLRFIQRMGFDTCVYCNRNYIYTVKKAREIKPEIDHFYPKSIYPLFAVSYCNLIPSCQLCNGLGGKNNIDSLKEGLVSPYSITDEDFKFSFKIKSIDILSPLEGKSSVAVIFKKMIEANSKTFNLSSLYELHNDHVLELILKEKIKYSEKSREYLNNYKGINFSNKEINRFILGNYTTPNETHKRPLAKLYQDIGKELGLID